MLTTIAGLVRFGFSLVFGLAVSALFAGIAPSRKNNRRLALMGAAFLIVQTVCWRLLGIEVTSKLYPVIIHLPVAVLFALVFKRPWHISIVSVLCGYLCCQAPRWFGFLFGAALKSDLADHLFYIPATFAFYILLKKFAAGSVRQLMEKSVKSCLLLGGVPLFYYLFDYQFSVKDGWFIFQATT